MRIVRPVRPIVVLVLVGTTLAVGACAKSSPTSSATLPEASPATSSSALSSASESLPTSPASSASASSATSRATSPATVSLPTGDPGNVTNQPGYPTLQGVRVTVTSHGFDASSHRLQVIAAATGTVSEPATCVATSVRASDGTQASSSVSATFDGRGLSCGLIEISLPAVATGTWRTTVVVKQPTGQATAPSVEDVVS